jgi:hypothetical protein
MIGTSVSMARLTAEPIAPEELSTASSAGESFSSRDTAPAAASAGSLRAICLISEVASLMRRIGLSERQPNALRRKRAENFHV